MTDTANRSVKRAFRIVDDLTVNGAATVSDIAERVEIPVSTVYNYLQALIAAGFVVKEDKRYRLTTRFLEIGNQQRQRMDIYNAVASELESIADETGEQATLIVEENGEAVLLAVEEGDEAVDLLAYPGARMPLYANAGGKAILAHMSADRRQEYMADREFTQITKHTVASREALQDQLETIRERGYAIDEGERIVGFVCLAVPILDRRDTVRGAICVCGPSSRMTDAQRREITDSIQRAANITQVNMDYV